MARRRSVVAVAANALALVPCAVKAVSQHGNNDALWPRRRGDPLQIRGYKDGLLFRLVALWYPLTVFMLCRGSVVRSQPLHARG